jgi:hypothetical protein
MKPHKENLLAKFYESFKTNSGSNGANGDTDSSDDEDFVCDLGTRFIIEVGFF